MGAVRVEKNVKRCARQNSMELKCVSGVLAGEVKPPLVVIQPIHKIMDCILFCNNIEPLNCIYRYKINVLNISKTNKHDLNFFFYLKQKIGLYQQIYLKIETRLRKRRKPDRTQTCQFWYFRHKILALTFLLDAWFIFKKYNLP